MGYYGYGVGAAATPRSVRRFNPVTPTSGERGDRVFPERLSANDPFGNQQVNPIMEGVTALATGPAYAAYERPIAFANTLTKKLTGTPYSAKGPVGEAADFIGQLPVIGPAIQGANRALEISGSLHAAASNSQQSAVARYIHGMKDSDPLPPWAQLNIKSGQVPILDRLVETIRGDKPVHQWTVGDARAYLESMGYSRQDEADLAAGRKGLWDFGDYQHRTHPDQMIDLAGRIIYDPLNATAVLGPGKVLGSVGSALRVSEPVKRLLGLTKAQAAVRTDPVLAKLLANPRGIREGVRALQAGTLEGVSTKSMGLFFMGLARGGGALMHEYRKGSLALTGGQLGVNLFDMAVNGNASPGPGLMGDIFEFGRAMRDDRPLSKGMLFTLWSVTHTPVRAHIRGGTEALYKSYRSRFPKYADIEAKMIARTGAKTRAEAIRIAGGEAVWLENIEMLANKHAEQFLSDRVINNPSRATMAEIIDNVKNIDDELAEAKLRHPMGGDDADRMMVDWGTGARLTSNKQVRKAMAGLRATWDPQRYWSDFRHWLSVAQAVSARFVEHVGRPVVPALRVTPIKGHLEVLKHQLADLAKSNGGYIPVKEGNRLILQHPSLLAGSTSDFWARMIVADAEPVKWSWARTRLNKAIDEAYDIRDVLGSPEAWAGVREREAQTRRNIRRPDGSYDLGQMDAPGKTRVYLPTTDDLTRQAVLAPQEALEDVLTARAATADVISDEVLHRLHIAGFEVSLNKEGIVIRDGMLAPGNEIVGPATLGEQRAAELAVLLQKLTKSKGPVRILMDGDAIARNGKTPNAVRMGWTLTGMDDFQRQEVVRLLSSSRYDAWLDDTIGMAYVLVERGTVAKPAEHFSKLLGELFPDQATNGILRPESAPVWTLTVRETKGALRGKGRTRRARGDERSAADVREHAVYDPAWHAAVAGLDELGADGGGLGALDRVGGLDEGPVGSSAAADTGVGPPLGPEGLDLPKAPRPTGLTGEVRFSLDRDAEVGQFIPKFGNPYAGGASGHSITEKLTVDEQRPIATLQEKLFREDPTYTLSVVPRGGRPYKLGDSAFTDMVIGKQAAGDLWWRRVASPFATGMHVLFGKVYSHQMVDDFRQALMNRFVYAGATPKEVDGFLGALEGLVDDYRLFGMRVTRIDHLDPKTIDKIAREGIGKFKGFSPEVMAKIGNPSEQMWRSASRIHRELTNKWRLAEPGGVGRMLDATFGVVDRGYRGKTGKYLNYLRVLYPLIRFRLDPRWYLMNWYESRIIGAARYSVREAADITKGEARAIKRFGGYDLTDAQATGWLDEREHMERIMAPAYRETRVESAQDVVMALAETDDLMIRLRKTVGDDATPRQLAEELDRMMYGYDTVGVARHIDKDAQKFLDEVTYKALKDAGVLTKLTAINKKQWDTVLNSFRGNVNRSNAERVLNSYFLYWPISYQLKVTKILFDVLTDPAKGGLRVWTMDRLYQEHKRRLLEDPDYRKVFEDNPTLWMLAGMMWPVTPFDIGLSESRLTRYAQSGIGAALGFWEKDPDYPSTPAEIAGKALDLGMPYSLDLLRRAERELLD